MAHLKHNPEAPGSKTLQEAINDLHSAADKFVRLAALCNAVGNIGGSWTASNFQGANNNVFDVAAGDEQAFNDQIVAINSTLQTAMDSTTLGRLADLDIGE
jgi:hypothetical protein